MNPDVWTNRFTVRKFSETNREINPEHLEYLETVLNNLPLQCNTKSDIWIYLDDSDKEIREWLEGNICRCTGYQNIVAAVKEAATKM